MINFNGYDLSSYFKVNSIKRPIMPPQQFATINIANRPGVIVGNEKDAAFAIEVGVIVKEKSLDLLRKRIRMIASKLKGKGKLIFSDEPDIYYNVIVQDTDLEEILSIGQGTILFFAHDPYAYGQEIQEGVSVYPTTVFLTPFMISEYETSSSLILNGGTVEADQIFEVTFHQSVNEFRITHQEQGKYIRLMHGFNVGDVLVIDCKNEVIRVNGTRINNKLTFDSDYFKLQIGENTLTVSPSVSNDTVIRYEPRYL
ncbi:distal tail protein Dit [Evansella cellulosilytica]|uniref:Phage tail component n=1 Tax=Evansella cellulosilytica (strain ATCC 21833 / DSM 2522 / FERM P-1141 / JCM 9156 / N-4) TaxID=649639 RepID=E6U1K5_EVAC2|nr:distal tail protein Dit [Evansella cellulosilytica]ADU30368.1 phage tail component [Evansella cellulosilytica DSM 2522]